MESKKETTAAILAAALLLIGSALGFSFSVSGDVGGLNQDIYAEIDDSFSSSVVLSENALSNNIKSSGGSLLERHWISDDYGNKAEVGVDIKDAGWYSYSYTLESSPDYASAGEALDVIDAKSIKAYSKADSHLGDSAESSIIISDKGKGASLLGYSNYAYSSSANGINACLAEQMFNSASGDRITVNEYARQFDGDAAFNRVNVADGQVDSYFGAAVAGIGEYGYYYDYGYESGYWGVRWDDATAMHSGTISGKIIDISETASKLDGDTAWAKTNIQKGRIEGYYGNASVANEHFINSGTNIETNFLDDQWMHTTWVSHGARNFGGKKVSFEEGVIQADGDIAGSSLTAYNVPLGESNSLSYFGEGEAVIKSGNSWDGYSSCNDSSNYVMSHHFGDIVGEHIDIDQWSRRADGDRASTSARINDGQTWYNGSAGTEMASSICYDPVGVIEEVTDLTWSYLGLAGLNGKKIDLTARAVGIEGSNDFASLKLDQLEDGNYFAGSSAEILNGSPSTQISIDWLPEV